MNATTTDWRAQRGLRLLKSKGSAIRKMLDDTYMVPSESGPGGYVVDLKTERCNCPDWEKRAAAGGGSSTRCKHTWAVLIHSRREVVVEDKAFTIERTRMDWSVYRRGRREEKSLVWQLGSELCSMIPSRPYAGTGRRPLRRGDVLFAGLVRGYETIAMDRCESDLKFAQRDGLIQDCAHYNTVYNVLGTPTAHEDLRRILAMSVEPYRAIEHDFAFDSSGLHRAFYVRWVDHKHGAARRERRIHEFMKLHVGIGRITGAICAIDTSPGNKGDGPFLRESLLPQVLDRFDDVETALADAAYGSRDNRHALTDARVMPYVDFAENARYGRDEVWNQCLAEARLNRARWERVYHDRNAVEAFFSSLKRVFGAAIRSKTDDGAVGEVLCRAIAHNLRMLVKCMFKMDLDPKFTLPSDRDQGSLQ